MNTYTEKEVSAHNTPEDSWTIIDNNVYNITGFMKIHPGGSLILSKFAGKNATNVFNNVVKHTKNRSVHQISKLIKIGEIKN